MKNESVVVEQFFAAPVEKVWHAITDPEQMRQWYFPMMKEFRPEIGFETEFDVVAGDKHFLHIWKITDVMPGKKISYNWKYGGYPGDSTVTFELHENGAETRLILTHEKLETFQGHVHPGLAKENFLEGWKAFIQVRLKDYINSFSSVKLNA
jgi:uncharacterized protein YndB with AHSA1/START domain